MPPRKKFFQPGKVIGEQTILGLSPNKTRRQSYRVRCSCGHEFHATTATLRRHDDVCAKCRSKAARPKRVQKSIQARTLDLTGQTLNGCLVLRPAGPCPEFNHSFGWWVRDSDGNTKLASESNLLMRSFRSKRMDYYLYELVRKRAEVRRGEVPFNLKPEDIEVPECCPMRGVPLVMSSGGQKSPDSPTAVRVDPTKGWEPGNVVVVSWEASHGLRKVLKMKTG